MLRFNVYLLLFFPFTFSQATYAQDDNPFQYFEDGGVSGPKNTVFFDLTYLLKPAYVFSYERKVNHQLSVTAGLMFLVPDKIYKEKIFLSSEIEELDFRKANRNFSILLEVNYLLRMDDNKRNQIGIGYHLIRYDIGFTHDFYISRTLYSFMIKNRILISLNIQAGARLIKVDSSKIVSSSQAIFTYFDYNKTHFTSYIHAPLKVGIMF